MVSLPQGIDSTVSPVLNAGSGVSLKAQAFQPLSIRDDAQDAFTPPAKQPSPPPLPVSTGRCAEKGCVFPAARLDTGKCLQHHRQHLEPKLFHSRQPSMLLLDCAKFGLPDSESAQRQWRTADRRRLARVCEAFLEGAVA